MSVFRLTFVAALCAGLALGERLLALRESFLSQMIFQTFNGYALSQFKKGRARRGA